MSEKCEHTFNIEGAWGGLEVKKGDDGHWELYAGWTEDAVAVNIEYCPFCGEKLEHEIMRKR